MTYIDAIILGLVQGLTEFLPVSSSGHLEIGSVFLNIHDGDNLLFSVVVHAATALSTIVVFRREIVDIFRDLFEFKYNASVRYVLLLALSMVPVGLVGVLWKSEIESLFGGNILFVCGMLLITSLLLTVSHFAKPGDKSVGWGSAIIIGLSQALALLPGISRSGATISTALVLGVDREKAARFSFLMVLVPILGAMAMQLRDLSEASGSIINTNYTVLLTGFLSAFISGLLACRWMIRLVKRGKMLYFAIYCFVIATTVMILYW